MISLQYIPLSVRVRSWTSSLFNSDTLEEFIASDLQTVMNTINDKEKIVSLDTTNSKVFLHSMKSALIQYGLIAISNSSGEGKTFIKELFREFEIDNLKIVARMILSGKFQNIFYDIEYTPKLTSQRLSEVRSFNDLITLIDGTSYHIFHTVLEKVEQEKNVLYWELALDNYYANRMVMVSKRLSFDNRRAIKKILLIPIQFDRLLALYRYRFHYNVDPAEALRYVPNTIHLMTMEDWAKYAYAPSSTDFYQYLINQRYINTDTPNNASDIRTGFRRIFEKKCKQSMHKDLIGIESFLAFIQLKIIQYQKISTIIEAKSLNVSKIEIMQFL